MIASLRVQGCSCSQIRDETGACQQGDGSEDRRSLARNQLATIVSFFASVDAFIQTLQQTSYRYPENFADPKQCRHSNGPSSLNLLPMSRREAERDHVLLAETSGLPERAEISEDLQWRSQVHDLMAKLDV